MRLNQYIDVLIPRGGAGLIRTVVENSTVPVIETGTGNCHVYVDASADIDMAVKIILNAKTQRTGVCNACESLVIHKDIIGEDVYKRQDKLHQPESYKNIYKVLTLTMAPVVLSSVIYQVSGIIDSSLYSNILAKLGYDAELISSLYGVYSSKYKMLVNVPMAMATALGLAVVPGISSAMLRGCLLYTSENTC